MENRIQSPHQNIMPLSHAQWRREYFRAPAPLERKHQDWPPPITGRNVPNQIKGIARVRSYLEDGGPQPIDVMVKNMRFYHERALDTLDELQQLVEAGADQQTINMAEKKLRAMHGNAQEYARDAAPYMHSKLGAVILPEDLNAGAQPEETVITVRLVKPERMIDMDSVGNAE